jgi:hypothetical protein
VDGLASFIVFGVGTTVVIKTNYFVNIPPQGMQSHNHMQLVVLDIFSYFDCSEVYSSVGQLDSQYILKLYLTVGFVSDSGR